MANSFKHPNGVRIRTDYVFLISIYRTKEAFMLPGFCRRVGSLYTCDPKHSEEIYKLLSKKVFPKLA
ncbi:hypothetical protein SAMN05216315_10548 [Nitrosospira sp. Nsp18]|nr:hypothetical protein SAMN05216315_10548 [Nitrosospira sp. Nsp18]